eukprot:Rmarinus@m.13763
MRELPNELSLGSLLRGGRDVPPTAPAETPSSISHGAVRGGRTRQQEVPEQGKGVPGFGKAGSIPAAVLPLVQAPLPTLPQQGTGSGWFRAHSERRISRGRRGAAGPGGAGVEAHGAQAIPGQGSANECRREPQAACRAGDAALSDGTDRNNLLHIRVPRDVVRDASLPARKRLSDGELRERLRDQRHHRHHHVRRWRHVHGHNAHDSGLCHPVGRRPQ